MKITIFSILFCLFLCISSPEKFEEIKKLVLEEIIIKENELINFNPEIRSINEGNGVINIVYNFTIQNLDLPNYNEFYKLISNKFKYKKSYETKLKEIILNFIKTDKNYDIFNVYKEDTINKTTDYFLIGFKNYLSENIIQIILFDGSLYYNKNLYKNVPNLIGLYNKSKFIRKYSKTEIEFIQLNNEIKTLKSMIYVLKNPRNILSYEL